MDRTVGSDGPVPVDVAAKPDVLRRFGKDHLTLADWQLNTLQFQQPREDGEVPATMVCQVDHPGRLQRVELERGAKTSFPTSCAADIVLGLIQLSLQQDVPVRIEFLVSDLLRIMRWPLTTRNYRKLRREVERLKALKATFDAAWYSKAKQQVEAEWITGIIAEAAIHTQRGRRTGGERADSFVQFPSSFNDSLRSGALVTIDLEFLFSLKRPGAKALYRHHNKVSFCGRKNHVYERDLKELACGHLGMADSKDLRRNFDLMVGELVERGYFLPSPDRYQKIRPGVYRVRLELAPAFQAKASTATVSKTECCSPPTPIRKETVTATGNAKASTQTDAEQLVRTYYRERFGENRRPTKKDLQHARELLASKPSAELHRLTPTIVSEVKKAAADDVYFGFAATFYRRHVAYQHARAKFRAATKTSEAESQALESRLVEEKRKRLEQLNQLREQWNTLSHAEREAYRDRASSSANSEYHRALIARADLADPPSILLQSVADDLD